MDVSIQFIYNYQLLVSYNKLHEQLASFFPTFLCFVFLAVIYIYTNFQ